MFNINYLYNVSNYFYLCYSDGILTLLQLYAKHKARLETRNGF